MNIAITLNNHPGNVRDVISAVQSVTFWSNRHMAEIGQNGLIIQPYTDYK